MVVSSYTFSEKSPVFISNALYATFYLSFYEILLEKLIGALFLFVWLERGKF